MKMEFIDNIKTFFRHIYSDISEYISGIVNSPGAMTGVLGIIIIIAIFIVINKQVGKK